MEYLDFELPIKELEEQLDKCVLIGQESEIDVTDTCKQINEKLEEVKKNIYGNLTSWQRVQLSRHPSRPYTMDHIRALCGESFLELVKALDAVTGINRYRISSIEPNLLKDEIIEFVARSERFMPHFHMPLQSGNNKQFFIKSPNIH